MPENLNLGSVVFIGASRPSLDVIRRLMTAAGPGTIRINRRVYEELPECEREGMVPYERVGEAFEEGFQNNGTIFAVMACGIAVRAVAPLIEHKSVDPALLVLDPAGRFIIPVLSGHLGGANATAEQLARELGLIPVITTLSDGLGRMAVDAFLESIHCRFDDFETACLLSALLCEGKDIGVLGAPADLVLPDGYVRGEADCAGVIALEDSETNLGEETKEDAGTLDGLPCLKAWPKRRVLGVGCRRNIAISVLEEKIEKLFAQAGSKDRRIDAVATIQRKADEPALLELCRRIGCDLVIVPDEEVRQVESRFPGSDFVRKTTGLSCVAEPCAYLVSRCGQPLAKRLQEDGVSLALFEERSHPRIPESQPEAGLE